jgi:hypothetical protein
MLDTAKEKFLTKKDAVEFMGFKPTAGGYRYISRLVAQGFIKEIFIPLTPRPRYRMSDLIALAAEEGRGE